MQYKLILFVVITSISLLLLDAYIIKGVSGTLNKWKSTKRKSFVIGYWIFSVILILGLLIGMFTKLGVGARAGCLLVFTLLFITKLCLLPFIVFDDIRRFRIKRLNNKGAIFTKKSPIQSDPIPRSEFILKAGLIAAAVPVGALTYGMAYGVYDYRVIHQVMYLPNLPKAFDGIKLGQISDIHSGSFYNKRAVTGGVDLLMREKPDFIFFTGDLVNDRASEMNDYQDIFSKVKAPLGVYSSLGNHDYGDYSWWPDPAKKVKNHNDLIATHKNMGWDLLLNDNRRLKVNGEEIGILGVENWGMLNKFPKYGRMDLAVKNTNDLPVKLLLSHDPSHWQAQVLPEYPQIDAVFAGHTHGMQFGVRTKYFQWSPIEYIYKEWAGLYREGKQQLYVNVGYGFLGFSGRVGILPEITIFELKSGTDPALIT